MPQVESLGHMWYGCPVTEQARLRWPTFANIAVDMPVHLRNYGLPPALPPRPLGHLLGQGRRSPLQSSMGLLDGVDSGGSDSAALPALASLRARLGETLSAQALFMAALEPFFPNGAPAVRPSLSAAPA